MFDLKNFRKKNGLTQPEVANLLECGQSFLSKVEKGYNKLSEEMLAKLIAVYGIDKVQEFITEDNCNDDKTPSSRIIVDGDGNNFGGNYIATTKETLELLKEQSRQLTESQKQISDLLKLLSDSNERNNKLIEANIKLVESLNNK